MIIGFTKVRCEEKIIQETLDHWSQFCDGIIVVDDESTDRTVEICKSHPKVMMVIEVRFNPNREVAESFNRKLALQCAKLFNPDWLCCFDADERLYDLDWSKFVDADAVSCRLYDVYITEKDKDSPYQKRKWVGEEFRDIVFFYKNSPYLDYTKLDQRVADLPPSAKIAQSGFIKHFGKGFSIEHWEETCDYYMTWPKYRDKWKKRKGKAIHDKSDFGGRLIKFEDVLNGKETGHAI